MTRMLLVLGALFMLGASSCSMSRTSGSSSGESVELQPPEPPTTGNKWVDDGQVQADGSRCFVLVDEECGGTTAPDYLQYFEAPIFRTGYVRNTLAYAVDGSNVWVVDVADPRAPKRLGIVAGAGRALAIAGRDDRLYIAGGEEGLLVYSIDATNPTLLRRLAQIATPGPALDVALADDGLSAYVAAGAKGVVPIDLAGALGPKAGAAIPGPGFASGVAYASGLVYVASCSALNVVDPARGTVVGSKRLVSDAGQAPFPVKDVAVYRDLAFVAAGRWGIVVLSISNPTAPALLGNRTLPDDLRYYANGVTVTHDSVYVAAGDWGVDRLPISAARANTFRMTAPATFSKYCTQTENPDRKPAPEFATRLPPPRRQDPLDVVPMGDTVLAMGDASRIGVRAIDLYKLHPDGTHLLAGRYEEPGLVRSIAAGGEKLALAGKVSGLYSPTNDKELLARAGALPGGTESRVVALTGDGRVLALDLEGTLTLDGAVQPEGGFLAPALAVDGERVVGFRDVGRIEVFKIKGKETRHVQSLTAPPFRYGAAHALVRGHLFLTSADWEGVHRFDLAAEGATAILPSALLTREVLQDPAAWRRGPPRRILVPFKDHVFEVTSFDGRAAGWLHPIDPAGGKGMEVALPPGAYVAGASDGSRLYLVQGDRARYRTSVVEVEWSDLKRPPLLRTRVFTGSAVGAARLGDRLYVADADVGVRAFKVGSAKLEYLGDFRLEVAP